MNKYLIIIILVGSILISCGVKITQSKYFNEVKKIEVADVFYSEIIITLDKEKIPIILWHPRKKIKDNQLKFTDEFIDKFANFQQLAKESIDKNYKLDGVVIEYLNYHLRELTDIELKDLGIKSSDSKVEKLSNLYSRLRLKKVGIHPIESLGDFAIFDYTIDATKTDLLLVLKMNRDGKIRILTMES